MSGMTEMKNWKRMCRTFLLGVLALVILTTVGCGSKTSPEKTDSNDKEKGIRVVATIYPLYDFARQVVGDCGEVTMLEPPASESHSYEPTPQDIITIQDCDVFLYIGGESDTWVEDMLQDIDTNKVKVVRCLELVDLLEEEVVEGMEAEEHEEEEHDGEHEEEYDEHIWTTPANAMQIVEQLADIFGEADQTNKDTYRAQGEAYKAEIATLDQQFQQVVDEAECKTLIVGDRFPLRYFVEEYGLSYYAAFPGCSEDTEPSAATMAFLIDKVKKEQLPVVLHMELSNESIADSICESTGAEKLEFHSCHKISKDDFEAGVTYVDLMQKNVEVLKKALGA